MHNVAVSLESSFMVGWPSVTQTATRICTDPNVCNSASFRYGNVEELNDKTRLESPFVSTRQHAV